MTPFPATPWACRPVGEVCIPTESVGPSRTPDSPFRYVDISSVSNERFEITHARELPGSDAPSRARRRIRTGDVIVATTRPGLRSIARVTAELDGQVCSTGFCVLRPGPEVLTDWVFYGALSDDFVGQLTSKMRGATYPGVSDRDVLTSVLPIPPLAEQRRIVARIRECTERIDEARRLRQASLAEAAALAQAARFEAFGVSARRAPLASLIATGPDNGLYKHSKHYGTGTPILRINNFGCGDVLRGGIVLKRVRLDPGEGEHFLLRSGDIVVNRVNGSLDVVGKACLIASLDEDTVFESNMMRFAPDARKADPRYVLHFLASPQCREQIRQKARVIQQASINQKDVCGLEIPVPGLAEQRRIADSLDVTVECAARLLAELDDGQSELDPLRAAVLRKAFAGEL